MSEKPENVTSLTTKDIPKTSSIGGIKYLSCQGGGMKGIGYVGAIRELDNLGVLSQLEEVSGSSAGGIFALMIAIGCTADELEQEMLSMDFRSFQDKRKVGWVEASKIKQLLKGGKDLAGSAEVLGRFVKHVPVVGGVARELTPARLLRRVFNIAEKGASVGEKGADIVRLALGSDLGLWEGDALTHYLANLVARKTGNPNITFGELALLGDPFKKLTLTGSNLTTGKLEYYNATNTPNMPIIQAARISASFPGAYKPVILEDRATRVDGGLLENLPDVFNQPPYLTPDSDNGSGGNRHAFALSFTSEEKKKKKKIKSLVGLGKAMYSAKTSEGHLQKKYGNNIALIDTVGMGTLDFDASDELKDKLIKSGANSVRRAFRNVLEQEGTINYSTLPIDELIRIKVVLSEKNKKEISLKERQENNDILIQITRELSFRVDNNKVSKNHGIVTDKLIKKLENLERDRFLKKKGVDATKLTDEQLSEMCVKKREELGRITLQLKDDLRQLELAKAALELDRDFIVQKYKKDDSKNDFVKELQELKRLEDDINKNLLEQHAQKDNPKNLEMLKTKHQELKKEKHDYYMRLITKYEKNESLDPVLAGLFKDLLQDSGKSSFVIPTSAYSLGEYCSKDIDSCEKYIVEARQELEGKTSELSLFEQHKQKFGDRTVKATHFESLVLLNKELDKTIRRRTTVLTKINHFLIKKAPKLERVILGFSKAVAFISFVCWLPLGMPAVAIAKAVGHFSKDKEVKATANNVIDFFSLTDVGSVNRLRKLRDESGRFVKKMSENYTIADKSEITYLHKLHELYLKNSGVKVEDIFIRNPDESKDEYKERIKRETEKLYVKSQKINVPKDSIGEKQAAENLEEFKKVVFEDVKRTLEDESKNLKGVNPKSRDVTELRVLNAQLELKEQAEKEKNLREEQLREKAQRMTPKEREPVLHKFHKARKKHSGEKQGKVHTSIEHNKQKTPKKKTK